MLNNIEKYIAWLLPPVLGGSFYLLMYISSNFEGEIFSWESILFLIFEIGLLSFLVKKYLNHQQEKKDRQALGASSFFIALTMVIIIQMLIYVIIKQLMIIYGPQDDSIGWRHLSLSFSISLLLGLIIVGIQFLVQYVKAWNMAQVQKERLEKENAKARLSLLKQQLNPHFLFNNFNTLDGLIHEDAEEASNFLMELSDLYRSVLKYAKDEIILLEKEIEIVHHFNFLMEKRFSNNYQCSISIDKTTLQQNYVPPLALQLLLENAVKHNRIDNEHPLEISISKNGNYIVVKNKFQPKTQQQYTSGIGLAFTLGFKRHTKFNWDKIRLWNCTMRSVYHTY